MIVVPSSSLSSPSFVQEHPAAAAASIAATTSTSMIPATTTNAGGDIEHEDLTQQDGISTLPLSPPPPRLDLSNDQLPSSSSLLTLGTLTSSSNAPLVVAAAEDGNNNNNCDNDDNDNDNDDDNGEDRDGGSSVEAETEDGVHDDDLVGVGFTSSSLNKEKQEEIAKAENEAVFWSRMVVLVVLLCSTIAVSVIVAFYLRSVETNDFKSQFESDALKVLEAVGRTLDNTLGATDTFIVNHIAYARYTNATYPFVTLPNFYLHTAKLFRLSKAFHLCVQMVVLPEKRDLWEAYAAANNAWVAESINMQANDPEYKGQIDWNYTTSYSIFGYPGPLQNVTPGYLNMYIPAWQQIPVIPEHGMMHYNWDGFQIPNVGYAIQNSFLTQMVTMAKNGNLLEDPNDPKQVQAYETGVTWTKKFISPEDDSSEPFGLIMYPMLDTLESVRIDITKQHTVVGVVTFIMFWRELIRKILPQKSKGIVVVFDQACGMSFTYQLYGPESFFIGPGDLHDKRFDYLGHDVSFGNLMKTSQATGEYSYSGLPVSDDFCTKSLRVYPSQQMLDDFETSRPVIFALVAALIFIFTSIVFVAYDFFVARRQRIVLRRALASGNIVSSLFHESVRKELYKLEDKELQGRKNLRENKHDFVMVEERQTIAEHFEETSIMFGDLAGFTKWSASRSPAQVLDLLGTLYSSFDAIAARRQVFKIETIGDCYFAATGIPKPQHDHPVRLIRFATDCMLRLDQIMNDLAAKLGADTANLQMRIGIHSGPTTGGVLRGQKTRYSVFGDTVNTASRMETLGAGGRIHCSQATADALIARSKGHWLERRDDVVVAKGKGEMQTYWVRIVPAPKKGIRTALRGSSTTTSSSVTSSTGGGDGSSIPFMASNELKRRFSRNQDCTDFVQHAVPEDSKDNDDDDNNNHHPVPD